MKRLRKRINTDSVMRAAAWDAGRTVVLKEGMECFFADVLINNYNWQSQAFLKRKRTCHNVAVKKTPKNHTSNIERQYAFLL